MTPSLYTIHSVIKILCERGKKKMRTIYWTIALAIVGGVLATKSAVIQVEEVFKGSVLGGLAGLVIDWSVTELERKRVDHRHKEPPHN
jgi:hypothetical protein